MNDPGRRRGAARRLALSAVALLAFAVFANTLGHGFAYDDVGVIVENPTVTSGEVLGALDDSWWTAEAGGGRLYRPVTQAAFAAQWRLFNGAPAGFHAVNLLLHALVSVAVGGLILILLGAGSGPGTPDRRLWAAFAGGAVFALHPVHVEAVANVVGQAELWSTLGVLAGVGIHLWTRDGDRRARVLGTLGVGVAFALAFGAKEIGVTLPALLLWIEITRRSDATWRDVVRREAPRALVLAAVGGFVLAMRWTVLGGLSGEDVTTMIAGASTLERVGTVLPVWVEYLRLMVWPVDLAVDYDPGVIFPASGPAPIRVALGAVVLGAVMVAMVSAVRRPRLATVGIGWFALAVLPVSNLLIPTGSLLAERTLYLPSVGFALVVAGCVHGAFASVQGVSFSGGRARVWAVAGAAALVLFASRTWTRNPVWESSASVMQSLVRDHPESWRAHLARAQGLAAAGRHDEATVAYRAGVEALPDRYAMVLATGIHLKQRGRYAEARPLLEHAVSLGPDRASSWRHLAELDLLEGRFLDAHRLAARGIGAAPPSGDLWSVLAEAYAGAGWLDAAVRAKRVALELGPARGADWGRLADLLEAAGGDAEAVVQARARSADPRTD